MSSPANAVPALPAAALPTTDRRAFLATLAAAGVMTGATTALAAVEADHLDAELLALDILIREGATKRDEFAELCDETYARCEQAELPKASFWQRGDFPSVWVDPDKLDGVIVDGEQRPTYTGWGDISGKLRAQLATWRSVAPADRYSFSERDVARLEEIIAALDAWEAENRQAEDACGYTAAQAAHRHQSDLVRDLVTRVVMTPARTSDGICVKVRALLVASGRCAELIEANFGRNTSAIKLDGSSEAIENGLVVSMMIDAMKLDTAAPAASSERSAA